jgi:hypothetical protein
MGDAAPQGEEKDPITTESDERSTRMFLVLRTKELRGEPLGAHKVESALFKFALWQLLL